MHFKVSWLIDLTSKDEQFDSNSVRSVCFDPNGNHVLIAVNFDILIYQKTDGKLIQTLKNHKNYVTCITYSKDGKRFATGSVDKQVIIWTSKFEPVLRYSHSDAVRCLKYNPVTHQLVSCSSVDFGLWSMEQKTVSKFKVSNAINCCAWNSNGQLLALGLVSGIILIKNKNGEEKIKIDRNMSSPIWTLDFKFDSFTNQDLIAVVDFNQTLTFFDLNSKIEKPEINIGFDAQFIQFIKSDEFFIIGGSNRQVQLYTKEAIFIDSLCDKQSSWIRSAEYSSFEDEIAIGTNNGQILLIKIGFNFIYSVYKDLYAYRDKMTNVIVHDLKTENKIRIKCHELVKKISLNRKRLAIQLPDKIIVYNRIEQSNETNLFYQFKEKFNGCYECDNLVVFMNYLLILDDKKAKCYSMSGLIKKDWSFDYKITCAKSTAGKNTQESVLIGLQDGKIYHLFLNNSFPVILFKINNSVCFIDLNISRNLLLVGDSQLNCYVYNYMDKVLLYQELNVNAAVWNLNYSKMYCFTGGGALIIKIEDAVTYHQQLQQSQVISFIACKILYLQNGELQFIEVTQSVPMYLFIKQKQLNKAYEMACLNVTDYDWTNLAHSALEQLELVVARKCFIRTHDYCYLNLIKSFADFPNFKRNKASEISFLGDVYAYKNRFIHASKLYLEVGHDDKAISMYTDLRMFDFAQNLIQSSSNESKLHELAIQKAQWVENMNKEPKIAAEMYINAGEFDKGLELMDQINAVDLILNTARKLDKVENSKLKKCAQLLIKQKQYTAASEIFLKISDYHSLSKIYIETKNWVQAFKLLEDHPEFNDIIYISYANFLAENDQFVDAQKAFYKAGEVNLALQVLQQLTKNAITEKRFNDASYYSWILSMQYLDLANTENSIQKDSYLKKFFQLQTQADIYFVYHNIHRFVEQPFTSIFSDTLFNMARYLFCLCLTNSNRSLPENVSKIYILYTLAKQSKNLGAYKLARMIYEQLDDLHTNKCLEKIIELENLTIRAKPFNDAEDLLPLCYRCSTLNPLYNLKGNSCVNCNNEFNFSFSTFDILPVVEFFLDEDLNDEEALIIIKNRKINNKTLNDLNKNYDQEKNEWLEEKTNNAEYLRMNYDERNSKNNFDQMLNSVTKEKIDREMLSKMCINEILILKFKPPLKNKYFHNLIPEISLSKCDFCNRMFHSDELESQILMYGQCLFCRNKYTMLNRELI